MKKIKRLLCLTMSLLLLCGCGTSEPHSGDHSNETGFSEKGKVTVYSEQQYKTALLQRFSHINLTEKDFSVEWVDNQEQADIVITDCLNILDYHKYRPLNVDELSVQPLEQLMLRDDRGVIGLPVLLRMSGFWYDELFYQNLDQAVPRSIDSWKQSDTDFPAVCEKSDYESLFWGVVAPMYLYYGGTSDELSSGKLQQSYFTKAIAYLQELCDQNLLRLTEDSRQLFTTTQVSFWLASDQQIAASYNFMSNRSKLGFSSGLILPAGNRSQCIVRSDVILVHQDADPYLTDLFLRRFFEEQTLVELSSDTQLPIACQIQYGPSVIAELAQMSYSVLSSPSVEIVYINCGWNSSEEAAIRQALQDFAEGAVTADESTDLNME